MCEAQHFMDMNYEMKNIDAFKMWWYKKIFKVKWTDKVSNSEVRQDMYWQGDLKSHNKKVRMIRHNLRHPGIVSLTLKEITEGKIG